MQFNSFDFMIFFPIVTAVYFVIPRRLRMYWLLVASYYFYMSWNAKYAVLIATSTVITFFAGLAMERLEKSGDTAKRVVLSVCIIINLGILAVFKYGNFTIDSVNRLLGLLHIRTMDVRLDFLLPVGISFYTFQALGYIIDVYRGSIEAEKNPVRYALFVSFFPQLVAGPIERSKNLLGQMRDIEKKDLWNYRSVASGINLIVWGLFMKMVIADRVSILVDNVFDNYRMYGSTELIIAAVGFSLQIYCDFASYSIIAMGCSKILGFELMENFNAPYLSLDIGDFWRRWHISLSTWFRDYLYIPLGGNRKGKIRKAVNTMIVFLVSGLWHGAAWKYVIWGGLHGCFNIASYSYKPLGSRIAEKLEIKTECFSWKLLRSFITFVMVTFAWIFFRARSVSDAFRYIKRIIIKPTPWVLFNDGIYKMGLNRSEMNILIVSAAVLLVTDILRKKRDRRFDELLASQNLWFEWMTVIILILSIFVFGKYGADFDPKQFIYFQF